MLEDTFQRKREVEDAVKGAWSKQREGAHLPPSGRRGTQVQANRQVGARLHWKVLFVSAVTGVATERRSWETEQPLKPTGLLGLEGTYAKGQIPATCKGRIFYCFFHNSPHRERLLSEGCRVGNVECAG